MATTIERRVATLEASTGVKDKCPGCGFGRGESPPWRGHIVGRGEGAPDWWCRECGRKLIHNVNLHWGHGPRA